MTSRPGRHLHALYRFYSVTGQLLYVGITNNPGSRFQQHQQDKPWWADVAGISVERHNTRDDALAAETRAIAVEHPLHNKSRPTLPSRKSGAAGARIAPHRLVWACDTCHQPINDRDGWLHLDRDELRQAETTRPTTDSNGWAPMDIGAWLDWEPAHWQLHHRACDPNPDGADYSIDIERARTHAQLLRWTAHLMGKRWLEDTDWVDLIERMSGVTP